MKLQVIELLSEQLEEQMFYIECLVVNFCVNIKISMKRDIFLRYNYEIVVYIHMLNIYCLFYFYFIIYR